MYVRYICNIYTVYTDHTFKCLESWSSNCSYNVKIIAILSCKYACIVCICIWQKTQIFLLFLSKFSNNKEEHQKSIFTQCDKRGFRLKDSVQFHLYISTSPCGDARIFSPHEAGVEGEPESLFNQTIQCFIRDLAGVSLLKHLLEMNDQNWIVVFN